MSLDTMVVCRYDSERVIPVTRMKVNKAWNLYRQLIRTFAVACMWRCCLLFLSISAGKGQSAFTISKDVKFATNLSARIHICIRCDYIRTHVQNMYVSTVFFKLFFGLFAVRVIDTKRYFILNVIIYFVNTCICVYVNAVCSA